MKKYLLALLVLISACHKQAIETPKPEVTSCDFGQKEFSMTKRNVDSLQVQQQKTIRDITSLTVNPSPKDFVFLIDFDGFNANNIVWGTFNAQPAALSDSERTVIVERVKEVFKPYNVFVTMNENQYYKVDSVHRVRCVVTDSWEWYGRAGGVSYINSITWGNETPCFVFSSLLRYNVHNIAEAVAHEFGHTVGLYHQSWFEGCTFRGEYYYGDGTNAPIMGCSYYVSKGTWWKGYVSWGRDKNGCPNWIQDDNAILTQKLGLKWQPLKNLNKYLLP